MRIDGEREAHHQHVVIVEVLIVDIGNDALGPGFQSVEVGAIDIYIVITKFPVGTSVCAGVLAPCYPVLFLVLSTHKIGVFACAEGAMGERVKRVDPIGFNDGSDAKEFWVFFKYSLHEGR